MKRIKTFNELFEASKMNEDCEEFFRISKGTEELKQIETWYKLHPTRTGRINVKTGGNNGEFINNPGNPYFYKSVGDWHFTFVSSGQLYGMKYSHDLIDLLKTFIRDIVFKFAPSDFNRKEAREMVDDDSFIFSKMWDSPRDLYVAYRAEKRSDIITDLSIVKGKSKLIDKINSLGNIYIGVNGYSGIVIALGNDIVKIVPNFLLEILGVKKRGNGYLIANNANSIEIVPKGSGKKVISNRLLNYNNIPDRREIKISLGYQNVDELVKAIEKIVTDEIEKFNVYTGESSESIEEKSDILTDFSRSYLLGNKTVEDVQEMLDDYMKKNPTDMYLLDAYPEYKAAMLRRTGLKDYSAIGRKLKSGMI